MSKYYNKPAKLYFCIDLIIITLIYYLSYIFRYNSFNKIFTQIFFPDIKGYSVIFLLWATSITILFRIKGLHSAGRDLTVAKLIQKAVKSLFYTGIFIAVVIFLLKYKFFSRLIFFISFFLFCIFLSGWRIAIRPGLRRELAKMLRSFLKILLAYSIRIAKATKEQLPERIDYLDNLIINASQKIAKAIRKELPKILHRSKIPIINPLKKIARTVRRPLLRAPHRLKIILTFPLKFIRAVRKLTLHKIDRMMRIFLYLLILVLPFSKAGVEICFVITLSLWIIKRLLLKTAKLQDSILNLPIFAYVYIGLFSVGRSVYFGTSLHAFFTKFMEGILLYFIIIEVIKKRRHIFIIIGLLLCATVVVCIDGIIQGVFTGTDIFRHMPITAGGITAAFNHKNDLGGYLLIPSLIVLGLMLNRLRIFKKNWRTVSNKSLLLSLSVLFCLFIITMVLTNSRGAWIALPLGVLILYFFMTRRTIAYIFIFCCLTLGLFILSPRHSFPQIDFGIQKDAISRVHYWKDALIMIKDRPLLGNGINTYMWIVTKMHGSRGPAYAHNCYLQMAAEMGIIGLVCFLWIIIKLFSACISVVKSQRSELKFLQIGLLYGLLAFLIHSFIDTNLYSLQLGVLFWYMVGLAICVYRQLAKV